MTGTGTLIARSVIRGGEVRVARRDPAARAVLRPAVDRSGWEHVAGGGGLAADLPAPGALFRLPSAATTVRELEGRRRAPPAPPPTRPRSAPAPDEADRWSHDPYGRGSERGPSGAVL